MPDDTSPILFVCLTLVVATLALGRIRIGFSVPRLHLLGKPRHSQGQNAEAERLFGTALNGNSDERKRGRD